MWVEGAAEVWVVVPWKKSGVSEHVFRGSLLGRSSQGAFQFLFSFLSFSRRLRESVCDVEQSWAICDIGSKKWRIVPEDRNVEALSM